MLSPVTGIADPLVDVVATANFLPNVWKSKGSLAYESEKSLRLGSERLKSADSACHASLILSVVPNKTLESHEQNSICARLENKTSKSPLIYSAPDLLSLEAVSSWITKLSRGSGTAGNDLYRRCPGSCSPRYMHRISYTSEAPEHFSVISEAICGQVRDKDDNRFQLKMDLTSDCH
ncbi:MAG: hypothetical protein K1X79_00295 [Oligoflexia bacterium]|nr:hypothetical protein [Oligoflexia bacterium]